MKSLASFFHRSAKDSKQNNFARLFHVVRKHLVAAGMCVLALLLLGVLIFDGFVFYENIMRQRQPATGSEKKIELFEKEVADTLLLLDARQKKFDEILTSISAPKIATSSLKIR
jgi:hypothetical protein